MATTTTSAIENCSNKRERRRRKVGDGDTKENLQGKIPNAGGDLRSRNQIGLIVATSFWTSRLLGPKGTFPCSCPWDFSVQRKMSEVLKSFTYIWGFKRLRQSLMRARLCWLPTALPRQNGHNLSTFLINGPKSSIQVDEEFVFLMFLSRLLVPEAIRSMWQLSKLPSTRREVPSIGAVSESRCSSLVDCEVRS